MMKLPTQNLVHSSQKGQCLITSSKSSTKRLQTCEPRLNGTIIRKYNCLLGHFHVPSSTSTRIPFWAENLMDKHRWRDPQSENIVFLDLHRSNSKLILPPTANKLQAKLFTRENRGLRQQLSSLISLDLLPKDHCFYIQATLQCAGHT